MSEETIAGIMQTDFLSLAPEAPMREAVAQLVGNGTPSAPVVDRGGTMAGILTQKDCFGAALNAAYYQQWDGTVADHMTSEVRTLDAGTDLVTAAQMFLDLPYRSYPVLRGAELVGMLHRSDLLGAFLRFG